MTTEKQPDEFGFLCKLSDLRPGEGKHFRPAGGRWRMKPMAVFEENGNYYVTNFICPHSGGPLASGTLKDGIVECPWHAWRYHVDTGLSADKEDGHAVEVYETRIDGGDLYVGGIKRPDR